MSVFESSAAPYNAVLPTITYDETRGMYLGEVISRTGMLRSYGPSERSVQFEIENQLYWEYQQLLRDIELDEQNRAAAAEREVEATSTPSHSHSHSTGFVPRTIGMVNNGLNHGAGTLMTYGVLQPISLTGKSTGKITSKATSKKKSNGVLGVFSEVAREKTFVASVAGVTIAAGSRKALKKALIAQRNKHIQRIMMNVKVQQKEVERTREAEAVAQERTKTLRERIRSKKEMAEKLGAGLWTERLGLRGKNKNWEERIETLRDRIQGKKEYAMAAMAV